MILLVATWTFKGFFQRFGFEGHDKLTIILQSTHFLNFVKFSKDHVIKHVPKILLRFEQGKDFRECIQISASGHTNADQLLGTDFFRFHWMLDLILSVLNELESAIGLFFIGPINKSHQKYLAAHRSRHLKC